jgi:cytochrome c oxidase assembly protein subunit 15
MEQAVRTGKSRTFWLALVTTIAIFIVNTMGFIDTITGSTMGCGKSWPFCNGSIEPWKWDIHAWIEFGHRFLVFLASVLLVWLSVVSWRKYGATKKIRIMVILAILGIVLESTLGAFSVMFVNPPAVLATHMGFALLSFGSLFVLTFTIGQLDQPSRLPTVKASKGMVRYIWFTMVYLYLAIYFGSYVVFSGSGPAFRGFPFPTERYEDVHHALYIDIGHRSIALGLLLITFGLVYLTRQIKQHRPDLYYGSLWTFLLVWLQGASGALMVYTHLSIGSILLHVSIVSIIFAILCFLVVQSMYKPNGSSPQHSSDASEAMGKSSSSSATI